MKLHGMTESGDGTGTHTSQDRTFPSTLELLPGSGGVSSGVLGRPCQKHFPLGTRSLGGREDARSPVEPAYRAPASARSSRRGGGAVCQLSLGGRADQGLGKGIPSRRNSLSQKQGGTLGSRGPYWPVISLKPAQHTQEPGAERGPSPSSLWGASQGRGRALPQVLIV